MASTTERPVRLEVDCSTGTHTYIELTDEEIAQMEADKVAYAEAEAAREVEATRITELKTSARAKLVAGEPLSAEEAALIVL
jgi:hypothetical protein